MLKILAGPGGPALTPYVCPVCGKRFNLLAGLAGHRMVRGH